MRTLILLFLLALTACSTTPERPSRTYDCAVVGRHGLFVKSKIQAQFLELAEEEMEKIRLYLVGTNTLPSNSFSKCFREDEE